MLSGGQSQAEDSLFSTAKERSGVVDSILYPSLWLLNSTISPLYPQVPHPQIQNYAEKICCLIADIFTMQ